MDKVALMTDKYAVPFMLSSRFVGLSLVLGTYAALKAGVDVAPYLETLGLKGVGTCLSKHGLSSSTCTLFRTVDVACFRRCCG
jgi:hypothetical protein